MSIFLAAVTVEQQQNHSPVLACSWCGESIPVGAGRYRLLGRQYHVDCWEAFPSKHHMLGDIREQAPPAVAERRT
jgi:hypothetical protein